MKMVGALLKQLKISCEDTSPLISESMDHRISLGKKLRIKIHLAICGACQCYKTQLDIIKALARKMGNEDSALNKEVSLRPELKDKIKHSLKTNS